MIKKFTWLMLSFIKEVFLIPIGFVSYFVGVVKYTKLNRGGYSD